MSASTLRRVLAGLGALALLVGAVAWWGLVQQPTRELAALSGEVEDARAALAPARYERPPLGEALPGDARSAALAAARELPELAPAFLERLWAELHAPPGHGPLVLPDPVVDGLRTQEPALVTLADAARRRYAEPAVLPAAEREEEAAALDRGLLQLLASATAKPPSACLRRAAVAIRIGQDRAASLDVAEHAAGVGTSFAARRIVLGCARRAFERGDARALREAAALFRTLAAHPPPVAEAIQSEHFANAAGQLDDARALLEERGPMAPELRAALRAARAFRDAGEALGALRSDAYPSQFEGPPETWPPSVVADASAQAFLRALAAALTILATELREGRLPRAAPDDAALRDPFTGDPLRYTPRASGFTLESWGPDGRPDDELADDADDAARRNDVVLNVTR